MIIRFLPLALGLTLGQIIGYLISIYITAFTHETEQYIPWSYELIKALCVGSFAGLTTAAISVILAAILETKRTGSAKVKFW